MFYTKRMSKWVSVCMSTFLLLLLCYFVFLVVNIDMFVTLYFSVPVWFLIWFMVFQIVLLFVFGLLVYALGIKRGIRVYEIR